MEEVALSDCALEVEGRHLEDLFETAALALAHVMVDPLTITISVERVITLEAPGPDLLLYDWLSELIFRKDRDREIFVRSEVRIEGAGPFRLEARAQGGSIDPRHTALGADAKAVTFHQFALEQVSGGWRARVVIDI